MLLKKCFLIALASYLYLWYLCFIFYLLYSQIALKNGKCVGAEENQIVKIVVVIVVFVAIAFKEELIMFCDAK